MKKCRECGTSCPDSAVFCYTCGMKFSGVPEAAKNTQEESKELFEMGLKYYKGSEFAQDYDKAYELFHSAATKGNDEAMKYLGIMYSYGKGVSQDYRKAASFFQAAADQGNARATFNLGSCVFEAS